MMISVIKKINKAPPQESRSISEKKSTIFRIKGAPFGDINYHAGMSRKGVVCHALPWQDYENEK
jgi:hypothetical protein